MVKELEIWPLARERVHNLNWGWLQKVLHDETGKQPSCKYCEQSRYDEYDPFHFIPEPTSVLKIWRVSANIFRHFVRTLLFFDLHSFGGKDFRDFEINVPSR